MLNSNWKAKIKSQPKALKVLPFAGVGGGGGGNKVGLEPSIDLNTALELVDSLCMCS